MIWLAARDRETPALAKFVALATAAYALSPIDLIPDFIPLLGLLDDLVLVPAGLWLALRLIPPHVIARHRAAADIAAAAPSSRMAAVAIGVIWAALAAAGLWVLWAVFDAGHVG